MTLDTGDNAPRTGTALKRAAGLLVRMGVSLVKPITDQGGIYSYLMHTGGLHFYLVARGPPMIWINYVQIVSSQKAMTTIAREENRPILMALFMGSDPDRPVWMLFNPDEILEKSSGENRRGGIVMVNYDYDLGMLLMSPKNISTFWNRLNERWEEERGLVQTRLGRTT